jgi:hypothetical protein
VLDTGGTGGIGEVGFGGVIGGDAATPAPPGKAGVVKVPPHNGHFISCPAYCSGIVSFCWQFGQRSSMADS